MTQANKPTAEGPARPPALTLLILGPPLLACWLGCGSGATSQQQSSAKTVEIKSKSGRTLVLIPGGSFSMGSRQRDEGPAHEVTVSAFAMDKFEVTQDLLTQLEMPDASHFKDPRRPIEMIRWSEAALLCNERSRLDGLEPCYDEKTFACNFEVSGYRLPTEAEWEYAARAGQPAATGSKPAQTKLAAQACYAANSGKRTDRVGQKRANGFGLHDMLGNVAEWCNDIYSKDYYAAADAEDPRGPSEGKKRVLRGGSWKSTADKCRATARAADEPGINDACFARDNYGFRCVRRLSEDEKRLIAEAN